MQYTLTIEVPESGAMPELKDAMLGAIDHGLESQGFPLHMTTIERIADVVFDFLVDTARGRAFPGIAIPFVDGEDIMPTEEFFDAVKSGTFIDYDGTGYYATIYGRTKERVDLDDIRARDWPAWATFVVWYNR